MYKSNTSNWKNVAPYHMTFFSNLKQKQKEKIPFDTSEVDAWKDDKKEPSVSQWKAIAWRYPSNSVCFNPDIGS